MCGGEEREKGGPESEGERESGGEGRESLRGWKGKIESSRKERDCREERKKQGVGAGECAGEK